MYTNIHYVLIIESICIFINLTCTVHNSILVRCAIAVITLPDKACSRVALIQLCTSMRSVFGEYKACGFGEKKGSAKGCKRKYKLTPLVCTI